MKKLKVGAVLYDPKGVCYMADDRGLLQRKMVRR